MTATTNHPCFIQPDKEDSRIWRYIDFAKFISLISSRNLFLCRADLFKDPFEGSYSKANVALRPQVYKDITPENLEKMMVQISGFAKWVREWTYINCWHANEFESAAMWDLYAITNEAVAIEATYQKLRNVLPERAFLGLVNYIDYETEWLPEGNSFYPFMHKRKSFEHEKEVRVIIQELPSYGNGIEVGKRNNQLGIKIPIAMNELITTIHVSPTAPAWLVEVVAEVTAKYVFQQT